MSRLQDSDFCWTHDPRKARERTEARRRGGERSLGLHLSKGTRESFSIGSVEDCLRLLEEAAADVLAEAPSQRRARSLVYVALGALRVLEVGELENRVAALEEELQARPLIPNRKDFPWQTSATD